MKFFGLFIVLLLASSFVSALTIEEIEQNQNSSPTDLATIADRQNLIFQKIVAIEAQNSSFITKEEQIKYLNAGFSQMGNYLDEKINFLIMVICILLVAILCSWYAIYLLLKARRRL